MARRDAAIAAVLAGALALSAAPARAEGTLLIYDWTGYFPPELLARFEAEYDIDVIFDYFETNEGLLEEMRLGGRYDVIVPTDYMAKIMIDEGLLLEIDAPSLPNFKYVKPPFDRPWYDPEREYTVPYLWGTGGFLYDSRQVEGGRLDESWGEFFRPRPELNGKVTALDYQRDLYTAAAFYLDVDPCTEDVGEAQEILDLLLAQKPKLAWYASYPPDPDPYQATLDQLNRGEVGLFQYWDGGGRRFRGDIPTMVFVIPEEGSLFSQDNYAIPRQAPNPENARIFMDFMMDPKNAAEASNFTGYTNAIAGSEEFMSGPIGEDQARELTPVLLERLRFVEQCPDRAIEMRERVWARLWPRTVK
jgi:spermidine/putrescine transport system substrate-binding protein